MQYWGLRKSFNISLFLNYINILEKITIKRNNTNMCELCSVMSNSL